MMKNIKLSWPILIYISSFVEAWGARLQCRSTCFKATLSPHSCLLPPRYRARTLAYDLERLPPVSTNRHFWRISFQFGQFHPTLPFSNVMSFSLLWRNKRARLCFSRSLLVCAIAPMTSALHFMRWFAPELESISNSFWIQLWYTKTYCKGSMWSPISAVDSASDF